MPGKPRSKRYRHPAGGWGSVHSLLRSGGDSSVPKLPAIAQLQRHSKPDIAFAPFSPKSDRDAHAPAGKSIPVRIRRDDGRAPVPAGPAPH